MAREAAASAPKPSDSFADFALLASATVEQTRDQVSLAHQPVRGTVS